MCRIVAGIATGADADDVSSSPVNLKLDQRVIAKVVVVLGNFDILAGTDFASTAAVRYPIGSDRTVVRPAFRSKTCQPESART